MSLPRVIKIAALGHRKRIIASLAERPYEEAPSKSHRLSQIMFHDLLSQSSTPLGQMDPSTSRSMDMLLPHSEQGRRRRRDDPDCSASLRSYSERPRSVVSRTPGPYGGPPGPYRGSLDPTGDPRTLTGTPGPYRGPPDPTGDPRTLRGPPDPTGDPRTLRGTPGPYGDP
ncbi:unnamed protein product [Boreogadus saida]